MPPKDEAAQGAPGGDGGPGRDRLSGLRDETLLRVMSHLKAWEAVRLCALSKRWRDVWTSSDHLDIRQPCRCHSGDKAREEVFNTFVKNLLLRRPPLVPLVSFRLCWNHKTDDGDTNTWISHAIRHGAKEIQLSAKHHKRYPKPKYTSFFIADEDKFKTNLKILKLIHVSLDDTTLKDQRPIPCTCLQEIELNDCHIPHATRIQFGVLKRLTMINCEILKGLSVYAPKLVSLQFRRNSGYVPWIQSLGLLAASNFNHQVNHKYTDILNLDSCNLEILKLSHVKLDDTTLEQLRTRCTSLEKLELKDCSVVGKEIRSTSLRCLTMVNCEFAIGSVVHVPNLVSLCCTRPFRQVPQFQSMKSLVTASITLDDSCMHSDSQWTRKDDDKDEFDDDGDFFSHSAAGFFGRFGAEDSADTSDKESDQDEDESDHDGAHSGYEGSDETSEDWHDPLRMIDSGKRYVGKEDWYNVGNKEIRQEYNNDCGRMFGGDGILGSLSNVTTMDLLAHSEEELLVRELKSCPEFINLKTLSLGEWCITPELHVLAAILQRSPNLENLSLHLDMADKLRVGPNPKASSFACTNLKKVEITYCMHQYDIIDILSEFFDVNSISREKISVHWTACNCDVKRGAGSQAKRKAQTEAEKRPAKQKKAGK